MPVTIRPVEPADFQQWLPLWDGYNAFYGRSGPTAVPADVTAMTWSRFLNSYEPIHALVAERDGKLIGLVHYIYHRTSISIAPTCYLQDLYTTEDARGTGAGRALIEAVYERAKEAGSARVYWLTHETNETAMQLYDRIAEKSGFLHYRKQL